MAIVQDRNKSKEVAPTAIPDELVYETLADGTPVYYCRYKEARYSLIGKYNPESGNTFERKYLIVNKS